MNTECKFFTHEFVAHSRDLLRIKKWFLDYLDNNKEMAEFISHDVNKIEELINDVSYHIAELVAIEFREIVYWENKKGGAV